MPDRFLRVALTAALVLLALFVAQPYVTILLFSADARPGGDGAGDLSQAEASTVALFERAAPSVVYVFARAQQGAVSFDPETGERRQGGASRPVRASSGTPPATSSPTTTSSRAAATSRSGSPPASGARDRGRHRSELRPGVLKLGRVSASPPPIAIGTSGDLKVGQFTYAIGNPVRARPHPDDGVVSALQRRLPTAEGRELSA